MEPIIEVTLRLRPIDDNIFGQLEIYNQMKDDTKKRRG